MLDAPVSGGVPAAANSSLTFIVGGTKEGVELARPLLLSMGSQVLHCGEAGTGSIAKVGCGALCLPVLADCVLFRYNAVPSSTVVIFRRDEP